MLLDRLCREYLPLLLEIDEYAISRTLEVCPLTAKTSWLGFVAFDASLPSEISRDLSRSAYSLARLATSPDFRLACSGRFAICRGVIVMVDWHVMVHWRATQSSLTQRQSSTAQECRSIDHHEGRRHLRRI